MRNVKLLNGLLWGVNGLLGLGILAFAWFFLLKGTRSLKDFPWDDAPIRVKEGSQGGDDRILKAVPNPLEKPATPGGPTPPSFTAILKGTNPAEKFPMNRAAFIKSKTRNFETVVFVGEEIRDGEKPCDEFRNWKLVDVGKDWAIFSDGTKQEKLILDLTAQTPSSPFPLGSSGAKPARIDQPYHSQNFKSRMLPSTDPNKIVWQMDPDEIEWAIQNQDAIMDKAFTVSPTPGGIRILSVLAGQIGAARGLSAGDVIKDVNGQPLQSVDDVKTLLTGNSMRSASGMRVGIERAGRTMQIEFQPMPIQR